MVLYYQDVEQKAMAKAGRGRGGRGGRSARGGRGGRDGSGHRQLPEGAERSVFVPGGSYVPSMTSFGSAPAQQTSLLMGAAPYVPSVAQDGSEQDDDRRGRRGGGRGGRRGRR